MHEYPLLLSQRHADATPPPADSPEPATASAEEDYREAFDASPIPTWIQDCSALAARLDELKLQGVTDPVAYLTERPEVVDDLIRLIVVRHANRAAIETFDYDPAAHDDRISLRSEGSRAAFVQQFLTVWDGKPQLNYEYTRRSDHPGPAHCSLHWSAVVHDGRPDYRNVVVSIADVTHRHTTEQQIRRRADRLELLNAVNREISSHLSIDSVLQTIVEGIKKVLEADWVELLVVDEAGDQIEERLSVGLEGPAPDLAELLEGLAGWVLIHNAPTLSVDVRTDPRNTGRALQAAVGRGVGSLVIAPLLVGGRPRGTIAAGMYAQGEPFTAADLDMLSLMAAHASFAIQNALVFAQLEQQITAKDRIVASVSHELRTPLTAAGGIASELVTGWDQFSDGERRELTAILQAETEDAINIVEDLLVAARSDLGEMSLLRQAIDLRSQVDAVLAALGAQARDIAVRGINPGVIGDPIRVRQIIRNLVTNAYRYGAEPVDVVIEREEAHGVVRVIDSGQGVPEHLASTLFDEFTRDEKGVEGSTGLGLHIARTLAELMDGYLVYRREDGRTVFELGLPLG